MWQDCWLKNWENSAQDGKVYLFEWVLRRSKVVWSSVLSLPITDPFKKTLAQQHRLYLKICRDCGARNAASAVKCRKCRGKNLRWKKREIVR